MMTEATPRLTVEYLLALEQRVSSLAERVEGAECNIAESRSNKSLTHGDKMTEVCDQALELNALREELFGVRRSLLRVISGANQTIADSALPSAAADDGRQLVEIRRLRDNVNAGQRMAEYISGLSLRVLDVDRRISAASSDMFSNLV